MAEEFVELGGDASQGEPIADELIWTTAAQQGDQELPAEGQESDPWDTPEYRRLQATKDREVAALRRELDVERERARRLDTEFREVQERLDADRLRNASPREIHEYYQKRRIAERAEIEQQTEAQTLEREVGTRAGTVLSRVGYDQQTDGLVFGRKVDYRNYADLLESVIDRMVKERGTDQSQPEARQTPAPRRQVQARAPAQATRGRVSTARGRAPASLWQQYFKELDALPRGDPQVVVQLRKKYEGQGLDFSDMPQRRRSRR